MDLEFGGCQDVINKYRQDWSLEHDVKLLKFLEKFSQSLLSRTGVALKAVECFEQDLTNLSLNIQTVTQRFQSLSNKQFIEHCVLEEDISSYSKPNQNVIEVHSSNTNVLLNNALKSCLSSFHVHIKDSNELNKSNHSATIDQQLPPLIGSSQFKDYAQIFKNKHKRINSTQEIKADQKNSPPQNIYKEQLMNNSTNSTMDEDNNSILNKHDVLNGIRGSNCSTDMEDTSHGNNAIPKVDSSPKEFVPKVSSNTNVSTPANYLATESDKISIVNSPRITGDDSYNIIQAKLNAEIIGYSDSKSTSKIPSENKSFTNNMNKLKSPSFVPENDFFRNIMQVPKTQSLFDQDESEDPDDLFMYGKAKPLFDSDDDIEEKDQFSSNTTKSNSFLPKTTGAESDKKNDSVLSKKKESIKSDIQHNFEKTNDNVKADFKQNVTQVSNDTVDSENLPTPGKRINSQTVARSRKVESPFSSPFSSEVKDENNKFSLFSDHDESDDDELFISAKQKNSKENFKKLLEEKMSAFGAKSFVPNRNSKSEQDEIETEKSNSTIRFEDNGILPKCETSVLQSLVKNRPKVRNKRRPPSRKHLVNSHPDKSQSESGEQQEEGLYKVKRNNVTILSPSTEEEDLFVVPTTSLVHEISSSDLFSASSLLSPGSSLDTQTCISDIPNNLISQASSNYDDTSTSTYSAVKTDVCSSISNVSLFSTEPPPFESEFFDDHSTDTSVKPWNNKLSLFSDSDEDSDLFSTSNKVRLFNDHKATSVSNTKPGLYSIKPSQKKENDFFKEMFLSNSDDDDLFKSKDTPTVSQNKSNNVPKQRSEKTETNTKFNGNLSLTSTTEFVDPLSCFENNVTE